MSSQTADLPEILDGTRDPKELTDGSSTAQQQGFAILVVNVMDHHNRSSDPAAPRVAEDANLLDPLEPKNHQPLAINAMLHNRETTKRRCNIEEQKIHEATGGQWPPTGHPYQGEPDDSSRFKYMKSGCNAPPFQTQHRLSR